MKYRLVVKPQAVIIFLVILIASCTTVIAYKEPITIWAYGVNSQIYDFVSRKPMTLVVG